MESFYSVLKHLNSPYATQNLTHLYVFNAGATNIGKETNVNAKQKVFARAEAASFAASLPDKSSVLIRKTNLEDVFIELTGRGL